MNNSNTFSILLVDDIPENIQRAGAALLQEGYQVSFAESGEKALELVKSKPFHLILLDIMMPIMDGFEVIAQLKADKTTEEIPVIFLTAHDETERLVHGFQLGAVDYITKPFNNLELLQRVATHIKIQEQKQQLKELNATKNKFFSIIAHDLKSPVNAIVGLTELIHNDFEEMDDPSKKEMIGILHDAAKKNTLLIEDLLTWGRTQMGHQSFVPTGFLLQMITKQTLDIYQNQADKNKITLEVNIPQDANCIADISMIKAVLRNLVSNALKFTPKGGTITINAESKEGFWELKVTDTGVGIEQENLDKIFRLDIWFSTPGLEGEAGTGLGLMISKEFVEKNGGTIYVTSEKNKGSSFCFTIPKMEL